MPISLPLTLVVSLSMLIGANGVLITGGIYGRAYDSVRGVPLALVEIRTIPTSGVAVSGSDGSCSLQGLRLGRYTVVASKAGYFEQRISVNVTGDNMTVDLLLKPREVAGPATDGIVAFYPLDGSPQDLVAANRHAILSDVEWVPDRFGKPYAAAFFDGSNSYGLLGDILDYVFSSPVATFTVMGWAKTDSYPSRPGGGTIIAKAAGGALGPYQWAICHDSDGRVKGFVASKANAAVYLEKKSGAVDLGVWFHFALVFDGSAESLDRVQLFVNGVRGDFSRRAGTVGTSTADTPQQITIGGTHHAGHPDSPDNFYSGSISGIRIYNRALEQDEIQVLMKSRQR